MSYITGAKAQIKGNFDAKEILESFKPSEKIDNLQKLSEDEMTVTQLKQLKELIRQESEKEVEYKGLIITKNKKLEYKNEKTILYLNINSLLLPLGEEELFINIVNNCFEVEEQTIYVHSNHGIATNDLIKVIEAFEFNALISDDGDEEYGFDSQDGCKRALEPSVLYIKGKEFKKDEAN